MRMPFIPFKQRLWRAVMHLPVGWTAFIGFYFSPHLGWAVLALFIIYERNEDRWIHDQAHYDILGALLGMLSGILLLYVRLYF